MVRTKDRFKGCPLHEDESLWKVEKNKREDGYQGSPSQSGDQRRTEGNHIKGRRMEEREEAMEREMRRGREGRKREREKKESGDVLLEPTSKRTYRLRCSLVSRDCHSI